MYKKYDGNPTEIRSYIKNRGFLGINANIIFNEIQALYGAHAIWYRTVPRLTKKFWKGVECLKENP